MELLLLLVLRAGRLLPRVAADGEAGRVLRASMATDAGAGTGAGTDWEVDTPVLVVNAAPTAAAAAEAAATCALMLAPP